MADLLSGCSYGAFQECADPPSDFLFQSELQSDRPWTGKMKSSRRLTNADVAEEAQVFFDDYTIIQLYTLQNASIRSCRYGEEYGLSNESGQHAFT